MKFIIDRRKWRRGGNDSRLTFRYGETYLLNEQGNMCCLGQICKQLDIPDEYILGVNHPHQINPAAENYSSLINILLRQSVAKTCYLNTELAYKAVCINDDPFIHSDLREQQLTELFKKYDHEIEFIN